MPLISIIIPAYNAEKYLAETLNSLLAQTVDEWECIIVDDGSKDQTAALAASFVHRDHRFRLLRQSNTGISGARNNGFAATTDAPYVAFMDADDVYFPSALNSFVRALDGDKSAVGAHGLAELIDAHSKPLEVGHFPAFQRARTGFDGRDLVPWGREKPTTFETVIHHSRVFPPGLICFRRTVYENLGGFDAAVSPVEDWDMLIRLTRRGPVAFLDDVLLLYRRHENQCTTAGLQRIYAATRRVHRKAFYSPENTHDQLQIAKGAFRAWQRMKIREKWASVSPRRPVSALKSTAHIAAHACLLVRGKPM